MGVGYTTRWRKGAAEGELLQLSTNPTLPPSQEGNLLPKLGVGQCGKLIDFGISMAQLSFYQAMSEQISWQRCWKIRIHFTQLGKLPGTMEFWGDAIGKNDAGIYFNDLLGNQTIVIQ